MAPELIQADPVPARVMQEPFGCFRACVASLLGLTYEQADGPTPTDYGEIHDYRGWQRWAGARGLVIRHSADEDQIANLVSQGVLWIAYIYQQAIPGIAGEAHHCVLVQGDRIVHDPDPVQPQPPELEGRTLSELPELGWDLFDATVIVWGPDDGDGEPAPRPRHGLARAPQPSLLTNTPAVFVGASGFDTESGAITGDSAAVGGVWAGAGDADDFTVANSLATRTAISDTSDIGRYVISGASALAAQAVKIDFRLTNVAAGNATRSGVVARYTDTSNWIEAVWRDGVSPQLLLRKRVAGTITNVKTVTIIPTLVSAAWASIGLIVDAAGGWSLYYGGQGSLVFQASGTDSDFATGGTLASGKPGFYDEASGSNAQTRDYDNFASWATENDAAIFSGKTLEFRPDDTLRQDSGGTVYGRPSIARGPGVFIPQAGSESKVVRIVAKACRNDITQAPRDNIADSTKLEVKATPRYLVTPR